MLLEYRELIKTPEFWLETIQNELYTEVNTFMIENNLTQTQLAEKLGVSKGYISQILNGGFNHTLKKLIELSLAIGKVPSIEFKTANEWMRVRERTTEIQYTQVIFRYSQISNPDLANFQITRKMKLKSITQERNTEFIFNKEVPCVQN